MGECYGAPHPMTDRTPSSPTPPQIPGLKQGESFVGADGGPSIEQIQRMHAASSARLQAAMDKPSRKVPPVAPSGPGDAPVSHQDVAAEALGGGGVRPAGTAQFEGPVPPLLPPSPATSAPVTGPTTLSAKGSIPGLPHFDPSPYQAVIDHGDYIELILPGGRRSTATKDEMRERARVALDMQTQNVRWEEENRKKYGPKIDSAWDAPAPDPEKLKNLSIDDPKHRCTTCKHSVLYVIGYASASGFSHHHVSRSFCALIEDPEGGNLEFEDSPIYYCSHYERRWSTWAKFQLSRLEKRVVGKTGTLARVLKVIREDVKEGKGSSNG